MKLRILQGRPVTRAAVAAALLGLGAGLAGCAGMGDSVSSAFVDPAKYELYDCKQLEKERKALDDRGAELEGLMAKAQNGVAGPVVAELAYRNDSISVRGQRKLAEEAWRQNKCRPSPPATTAASAAPTANARGAETVRGTQPPARSDSAVY